MLFRKLFWKRLGSVWEASGKRLGSAWEASGKRRTKRASEAPALPNFQEASKNFGSALRHFRKRASGGASVRGALRA